MYNGLLNSNCETLRKVLREDLQSHSRAPSCWNTQILDAFQGLRRCESFVTAMEQGMPISLQDFTDDLRHRLRSAWGAVEGVDSRTTNDKLATYQAFFALPFAQNVRKPYLAARIQVESSHFDCGDCALGGWDFSSV
eukprot:809773-Pelagomonas_calceolata.AAC.1